MAVYAIVETVTGRVHNRIEWDGAAPLSITAGFELVLADLQPGRDLYRGGRAELEADPAHIARKAETQRQAAEVEADRVGPRAVLSRLERGTASNAEIQQVLVWLVRRELTR